MLTDRLPSNKPHQTRPDSDTVFPETAFSTGGGWEQTSLPQSDPLSTIRHRANSQHPLQARRITADSSAYPRTLTLKALQGKYYECITPAVNSSSKLLCGCVSVCVCVCANSLEEIHQCNEHRSEDYEILMSVISGFAMFCLGMNTHFKVTRYNVQTV